MLFLTGCSIGCAWAGRHDFRVAGTRPVSFATLGGFHLDQEKGKLGDIPLPLRQLDGQRIEITGYMIPLDQVDPITEFALLDRFLGRTPPPIQEVIVAHVPNGKSVAYFPDRLRVVGTLQVRVTYDDGYLISVYEVTVDHAEPADQTGH